MLRFLALVKDENEWNDPDREKPKYVEDPLISTSFSTGNPTWTGVGLNFSPPEDVCPTNYMSL
jgi:hypothetical protein